MIPRTIAAERERRRQWPKYDCQNEMPTRGERASAPQPSCGAMVGPRLSSDHGAPAGRQLTFAWEAAKLLCGAVLGIVWVIVIAAAVVVCAAAMGSL